jgi:cytochrome P450
MTTASIETSVPKTVPYTRGWPLLGSQQALKHNRLNFLQRLASTGDVARFNLGFAPYYLFNEPHLIEKVLVQEGSDFDRGSRLRSARIRHGIVTSAKEEHRQQRKSLAPFFQPRHVAAYAEIIASYGVNIAQRWGNETVIDLYPQMTNLTMNILGKMLFNIDTVTQDGTFERAIDKVFRSSVNQLFRAFTIPLPENWETPGKRRLRKARELLRDHLKVVNKQLVASAEIGDTTERCDFLALLLQTRNEDGSKLTQQQIARECWPLFFAGYNTSPVALTWAVYLLCQNPHVYKKLQQEVDQELEGRTPTYEDLARLPYCLQVFKEAIRLYPPAPMIRRETLRDITIDGYSIPKGAVIIMSPYTIHRNPTYFPNPEQFEPERFEPERIKGLPHYAYMPFGGGPRVCLGNHFAMMEGHLLLAILAQHLTFSLAPEHPPVGFDLEHNLALRPDKKIEIRVQKREKGSTL